MSKIIYINTITSMAMAEDVGLELRNAMKEAMKEEQDIVLDFEGIELFATPFFNSSIGYFVMKLTPEKYNQQVKVINLSDLGKETYNHSYQNALLIYENKTDLAMIGKITAETIEEQ